MKKLKLICVCFLGALLGLKAQSKPNVLVIYTDQQRYNTIRSLGNDEVITPNLDRLVNSGTAFTNSFVSAPVCMPSRWSLHSGMYTSSHGAYSNHHAPKEKPVTSLPAELKKNGYLTALVGKNHSYLTKQQMDVYDGGVGFKKKPKDGRSAVEAMPWSVEDDPMHYLTNKTMEVLEQSKEDGKPAFIWLSYLYPHTPYMCPEPYFSMYDTIKISKPVLEKGGLAKAGKPFRQQFHQINTNAFFSYDEETTMRMKRNYYGMVTMIDAEIGLLLDYLDENGLRDNTIIVFTSDHGDYMGDHGLYTKSPSMYDCLTRVPLIFNAPGRVKENQISDELVSNIDIMPTILEMLNLEIPEQVQGTTFNNVLLGEKSDGSRKYVFSEYGIPGKVIDKAELETKMPDYETKGIIFRKANIPWEASPVALSGRFRMVRSHDFKLVEEVGGTNELYDLNKDPNELMNVYGKRSYRKIQQEMQGALNKWKKDLPGLEKDTIKMGEANFDKYLKRRNK